ncbi:PE family protein, partial [Mycobacterium gordonae]
MAFLSTIPDQMTAAVTTLSNIGSALTTANAAAAAPTIQLLAAANDEVSTAIAALFSGHALTYQGVGAHAAAFHSQFAQALNAGAAAYAEAEAANVSPLQLALNEINGPVQTLTGRPLVGDGANGTPGTGQNGAPGGWLLGNGGAGGSGA